MGKSSAPRTVPDSDSSLLFRWTTNAPRAKVGFTAGNNEEPAQPALITDSSESHVLVLDIKGEAARVTARRCSEMGHEVAILDPFRVATDQPGSLNPLEGVGADPETVADNAFMLASLLSEGLRS